MSAKGVKVRHTRTGIKEQLLSRVREIGIKSRFALARNTDRKQLAGAPGDH